ncbi:tetratricopeptide (TPR) repeat protein [Virgibacillus halotolerans]|uniref:tetratricopeptide repeat protein n=1 Tax=Virgibacillus halotolerans TaxID=1071053 RepID=UPI00195FFEC9|nr:tetratricopeptide repeat protein [Virgibacillus halotolerans]MBM7600569.1 tetratricopeptide (TPR) repeat protein [Virgibacillus halotolerans]
MPQLEDKLDGKQNNVIPFIPEGDFYFSKGVEAFQKKKFDIAIKWLNKAMDEKPEDPLYACQMSIIYTEIGSYYEANELLTTVLQTTDYVDCYYLLANNYAHLGLLNDAAKYANAYLDKEPEGDFSEETKQLLDLIDIDEEQVDDNWDLEEEDELLIYQETAFYHMEFMEWDKALLVIKEMMTLFPEHQLAKHDYTQALFFSGQQQDAIEMELDILKDDANSLYSMTNLAVFYYEQGNKPEYENYIQALLNVYPMHEQQKLRIAVTLAKTGFHEQAYSRFRLLAKGIVKGHPSFYRWYSKTIFQQGFPEKAQNLWEEGIKKHPKLVNEVGPDGL